MSEVLRTETPYRDVSTIEINLQNKQFLRLIRFIQRNRLTYGQESSRPDLPLPSHSSRITGEISNAQTQSDSKTSSHPQNVNVKRERKPKVDGQLKLIPSKYDESYQEDLVDAVENIKEQDFDLPSGSFHTYRLPSQKTEIQRRKCKSIPANVVTIPRSIYSLIPPDDVLDSDNKNEDVQTDSPVRSGIPGGHDTKGVAFDAKLKKLSDDSNMDAAPECESSSNTLMSKSVVTSQMTDTAPQVSSGMPLFSDHTESTNNNKLFRPAQTTLPGNSPLQNTTQVNQLTNIDSGNQAFSTFPKIVTSHIPEGSNMFPTCPTYPLGVQSLQPSLYAPSIAPNITLPYNPSMNLLDVTMLQNLIQTQAANSNIALKQPMFDTSSSFSTGGFYATAPSAHSQASGAGLYSLGSAFNMHDNGPATSIPSDQQHNIVNDTSMSELMQLCTSADFSNPAWLGLLAGNSAGTASGANASFPTNFNTNPNSTVQSV